MQASEAMASEVTRVRASDVEALPDECLIQIIESVNEDVVYVDGFGRIYRGGIKNTM
jgi:hypothetical protein